MMTSLARRLELLESRQGRTARRMHFITAIDQADADRQIAGLVATGAVLDRDGFLCLTGKPSGS
ncbi:hypothetical protein [Bradyrhizobium sp. cf659]|uniref:hypothetical protein n=1 Tax=Bradyrhizobium sp. cf659 TaxID=1761771 RepID=UPI0011608B70|nr:hypothetical protein [Bradyrhizobium sp. cf659]